MELTVTFAYMGSGSAELFDEMLLKRFDWLYENSHYITLISNVDE